MERHVGARAAGAGKSDGAAQRLVTAGNGVKKYKIVLVLRLGIIKQKTQPKLGKN